MNEAELQHFLEENLTSVWSNSGSDPAHDIHHVRRVWQLCKTIAGGLDTPLDAPALQAAAVLHDLVNLPKDHPDRTTASARSAHLACDLLIPLDWTAKRLETVAHAIEAHSFSARVLPESVEARVLQDADRLEALGALGIARCFSISGQLGRALFDADDPLAHGRAPDDSRFALDHFETKLFLLPGQMQTAPGKALARKRVAFMRRFRQKLLDEIELPTQAP